MSIGRQVSRGVFWVGVSTLTAQALQFGTRLILMRILLRSDFGMVALATLAIGAVQLFREFGFSAALIYRRDRVREAADTMFVMLLGIAVLLCAIVYVTAPAVASFFYPTELRAYPHMGAFGLLNPLFFAIRAMQRLELISILRVMSLVILLGSLGQVPFVMLAKEMDFRKRLLPDIVPEVIKDTACIILALKGFGVWSLVYPMIIDMALTALLAWAVSPLRPRFHFNRQIGREMLDYGKHIQASQILVFLITNLDNAFVGRLRGDADLGVYGTAFNLSNTPSTSVTRLVGQVMFPALSKVRQNLADMRRVFLRAVKYTALVSIPLGVTIFVFAPPFMDILYGSKWHTAIVPMQLLVIYGVLRSIAGNMGDVFKAGGKPQWLLGIACWRLATMLILLYPATVYFGIVGVAALSAIVATADFVISVTLVNRIVKTGYMDFARILAPLLGLSLISVAIARLVFAASYSFYPPLALVLAGGTMVIAYSCLILVADSEVRQRMLGLMSEIPAGVRLLRRFGIRPQSVAPIDQP